MPELPEVTTVISVLKKAVLNFEIKNVNIYYPALIKNTAGEVFSKKLIGQRIIDIKRKGKYIIFVLDDFFMISHLRMEGKYFLGDSEKINKHDHIVFDLGTKCLHYIDSRKFGTFFLYEKVVDINHVVPLKNVGPEPFFVDVDNLYLKLKKTIKPIKSFLLDQKNISGLGNIYVDETLFLSEVSPFIKCNLIDKITLKKIVEKSIITLNKAISLGGTTIRSYESARSVSGRFQNELLVHTKKVCLKCQNKVIKSRLGGRGTYWCPKCQNKFKLIVGIYGRIGSGKSQIKSFTKCPFIDLDEVVKKIYLEKAFQDKVVRLLSLTEFNKQEIMNALFDKEKNQKLKTFLYPEVLKRALEKAHAFSEKIVYIEGAFLLESDFKKYLDKVILVKASDSVIIERIMLRDNVVESYAQKMLTIAPKNAYYDFVIENNGDLEKFKRQFFDIETELKNGII